MNRHIATKTRLRDAWHAIGVLSTIMLVSSLFAGSAFAATPAPGWEVTSHVYPTNLQPGHEGVVVVELFNTGAAPSHGIVTLTDTLPPGLTATETGGVDGFGAISNSAAEAEEGEEEKGF